MRSNFLEILTQRRSIRAFTDDRIDRATVERICTAARQAPSGANLQPGKFHALTGVALRQLRECLRLAQESQVPIELEYSYFPDPMPSALRDRQRRAGYALYDALGVSRRDAASRREQFANNYDFFGAPVGIIVTIDRAMGRGCFMDLGMSIMTLFLAAEDEGLGTTGIGAIANYGKIVHRHLQLSDDELVVCGVALGVSDKSAKVNRFQTERLTLEEFTTFLGFEDEG